MGFIILLLFIGVPIIEIATFIQVGDLIGLWPTLAVVVLTAIIGTSLLRHQGLNTLAKAQTNLNAGRLPAEEIFDGLCMLLAGALLLTPGFVTDSVGFLLFFPPFRALIRGKVIDVVRNSKNIHVMGAGHAPFNDGATHSHRPSNPPTSETIIDADFEEVERNPDSPWSEKKD